MGDDLSVLLASSYIDQSNCIGFILSFGIETKHTDKVSQTIFGFDYFLVFVFLTFGVEWAEVMKICLIFCILFVRFGLDLYAVIEGGFIFVLNMFNRVCLHTNRFIDLIFASGQTTISRNKKK